MIRAEFSPRRVLTNPRYSAYNDHRLVESRAVVVVLVITGVNVIFFVVGCSTLSHVDARGRTDFCFQRIEEYWR